MPGTPPVLVKFAYTRTYRDRHGKLRIEYRRSGKVTPLRGTPGTLEFQEAYDAARGLYERPGEGQQTKAGKVGSGTLRWLCVEYFKSAEFSQLAPSTQRARRQIFEGILLETISPKSSLLFADCPTGKFGQQHVRVLRDRKKAFPEAAYPSQGAQRTVQLGHRERHDGHHSQSRARGREAQGSGRRIPCVDG